MQMLVCHTHAFHIRYAYGQNRPHRQHIYVTLKQHEARTGQVYLGFSGGARVASDNPIMIFCAPCNGVRWPLPPLEAILIRAEAKSLLLGE
eukprot:6195071-Pleurochrysis_carterae.AAC.2